MKTKVELYYLILPPQFIVVFIIGFIIIILFRQMHGGKHHSITSPLVLFFQQTVLPIHYLPKFAPNRHSCFPQTSVSYRFNYRQLI